MQNISSYFIPILLLIASLLIIFGKENIGSSFLSGAKNGLLISIKLLPTMVLLMSAISVFSKSGAISLFTYAFKGVFSFLNVPIELMPLLVIRPISGSGATAMLSEIFANYGPDSLIGRCASVIAGSSDTILYTFAVYFSFVKIKKTRHGLLCAFIAQIFCIILSCLLVNLLF